MCIEFIVRAAFAAAADIAAAAQLRPCELLQLEQQQQQQQQQPAAAAAPFLITFLL